MRTLERAPKGGEVAQPATFPSPDRISVGHGRSDDGASSGGRRASITSAASGRAVTLASTPGRTYSLGFTFDTADRPSWCRGHPDCSIRAVAIATCMQYDEARRLLLRAAKRHTLSPTGLPTRAIHLVLTKMGWRWHPATGRLGDAQLPDRPLVALVDGWEAGGHGHTTAIIDQTVHDTADCRFGHLRGYYCRPSFGRSPYP